MYSVQIQSSPLVNLAQNLNWATAAPLHLHPWTCFILYGFNMSILELVIDYNLID